MTIELKAKDSGTRARLDVGERARVRLPENPTTGFRWVAEFDQNRLTLVEDDFEGPDAPPGAGGERVLVFEAMTSGAATVNLALKRAWEIGDPVETFGVVLDVLDVQQ